MSPSRRLRGPAGAVALATVLAAGAPAVAGAATTSATTKSASTITLGKAFRKDLRSARVTLKAVKPAKLKGSKLTLPVTKTTTSGTLKLTHSGALTLKKGKRSVKLSAWQTVAGKSVRVSAKVGKKRRTVFTITGGKIVKEPLGRVVAVRGGTVKLTSAAAKDLRTTLKAKGLRAGTVGAVELSSSPKPSSTPAPMPTPAQPVLPTAPATPAPKPTTPQPAPVQCPATLPEREAVANQIGDATWTLRSSWFGYLKAFRGCVVGTGGAETTAATESTPKFAVVESTTTPDGTRTVALKGTVAFLQPEHRIDTRVTDPVVTVNPDGSGYVVADGQGSGSRGAAMGGTSEVEPFTDVRVLDFAAPASADDAVDLKITAEGAKYLSYPAGESFGTLKLDAPVAPRALDIEWTQTNVYTSGTPARTWLGYATGSGFLANGTMTPSGEATGPTVTPASERGADKTYTVRFPVSRVTAQTARSSTVWALGTLTFASPAPPTGHGFTITITNPRIVIDDEAGTAKVYASGQGAGTAGTPTYDDSQPLFDLASGNVAPVDNGDGTALLGGFVPSLSVADRAFPGNYAAGAGPDRTPNTFGSFGIRVAANDLP